MRGWRFALVVLGVAALPATAQQPPQPPPMPLQSAWLDFYMTQQPQFQLKCGLDMYRFSRSVLEGITAAWLDPNTKQWVKLEQLNVSRQLVSFQGIGRPLAKLDQLDMNWFEEAAYAQGAAEGAPLNIDMQQHIPQRYYIDMYSSYTYSRIMPGTQIRFMAGDRTIYVTLPEAASPATPC